MSWVAASTAAAMAASTAQAQSVSGEATNEANNPLTPKITLNLQDYYIPSIKGLPERDSNQFLLRGVMPHKAFGAPQILRATVPIVTAPTLPNGDETGIGDISLFDLFLFKAGPGIEMGVGPVLVIPTAEDDALGQGKWQAGVSAVAIAPQKWGLLGALVIYQQSFAGDDDRSDVQQLSVQPFVIYNLPQGYYLRSTGTANFEFEQDNHYVPIGLGLGKVWLLDGGVTMNTFVEPQYTVWQEGTGTPKWQVFAGVNFQFPIGGPPRK
jgi:hypothetical protein